MSTPHSVDPQTWRFEVGDKVQWHRAGHTYDGNEGRVVHRFSGGSYEVEMFDGESVLAEPSELTPLPSAPSPEEARCMNCRAVLDPGEAETFTLCETCWGAVHRMERVIPESASTGEARPDAWALVGKSGRIVETTTQDDSADRWRMTMQGYTVEPLYRSRVVSPSAGARMSDGVSLIAAERARQVSEEGWDATHDDDHVFGEIAQAAACYALPADNRAYSLGPNVPRLWPWSIAFWKPTPGDRVRELVKAGALIAAEIDRLQRAALPSTDTTEEGR